MTVRAKELLIILLALIIIVGAWNFSAKHTDLQRTKEKLFRSQQMVYLEQQAREKVRLDLEGQLTAKVTELEVAMSQLNEAVQKIQGLEQDNGALLQQKQELEQRVVTLEQEKQAIENRLHDLKELRLAIRQVKLELHQQKIEEAIEHRRLRQEADARELSLGNRGYVLRDGRTCYRPAVRIEVKPADN